jgi:DNA-binding transcriptional LysR family regulator
VSACLRLKVLGAERIRCDRAKSSAEIEDLENERVSATRHFLNPREGGRPDQRPVPEVPEVLVRFKAKYASMTYDVVQGNTDLIVGSLLDQRIDLGLVEGPCRRRGDGAPPARIRLVALSHRAGIFAICPGRLKERNIALLVRKIAVRAE